MKHYLKRFEESVRYNWDNPALCDYKGDSFTFGEVATSIAKFHICFEEAGIKKGDKIALCAKNSARWAISFLAVNTYEAVVVPILADFTPESVNSLVDHSESTILFTNDDLWKKLDIKKMPKLKTAISVNDFSLLWSIDDKVKNAMADLQAAFDKKYPHGFKRENVSYPTNNDKDLAIINYTSGTTSAPKGVMLRFELIYPLCGGTAIYYLGKTPTPQLLLGAMRDVKPYLMITVPLVMEKIFKSAILPVVSKPSMRFLLLLPGVKNVILKKIREKLMGALGGNLRMIIMGGAALNPDVEKWFRKIGLPFTVGYGKTEAAPLLAYAPASEFVLRSCGRAVDRAEVRIDSEDPQHVVGQIQARGVNIMSGYFKNEEATKAAFTEDGWMNTGDLGVIDACGNIFIRGRSKNMILSSNGQNIYPEEIEAAVNNQPYVVESVVVDRASKLVALVYLDQKQIEADGLDAEALSEKLQDMRLILNKALPSYSQITKIEVVEAPFEKTPKMSIKRFLYK